MLPRFHAPQVSETDTRVTLDAEQSHHMTRVLRLREGDTVRVFDGRGREWEGRVTRADRREAEVGALAPVAPLPEPEARITLLCAVLRGAAMDTLVHDATMTGAAAIAPVWSERVSVARREDGLRGARARWQRIAIAAARQCGRATVPEISEPAPLATAIEGARWGVRLWLAEPTLDVGATRRIDGLASSAHERGAVVAIGPEGGWTPAEVEAGKAAGFVPWSLGPLVLRAESVPLAAMSVLRYAWA